MRRVFFILLSFISFTAMAQDTWDLEKCINYAVENNLQMKQFIINVESAEFNKKQAVYDFVPSLNAGASHGYNWGQRIDPFTNQFATERIRNNNFFLSSGIDLFNGFAKWHIKEQSEVNAEVAQLDLQAAKNDIILQIAGAYLNVLQTEELVTIAKNQIGATEKQVDRMQKLVDAGSFAIGSLYDIQAQLASEELNVVNQENNLILAKLALVQLMQLTPEQSANFSIVVPEFDGLETVLPSMDVGQLYKAAVGSLPDIASAEKNLQSSEIGVKLAKASLLPSLSANGSLGTGYSGNAKELIGIPTLGVEEIGIVEGTNEIVLGPTFETTEDDFATIAFEDQWKDNFNQSLSLSLSVPIFNGWQIRNGVKQSQLNMERSKVALEQTKNVLYQEVQQAYTNTLAAYNSFQASQKSLDALELNYDNAEKRYEQQVINAVDFNDAKTRFLNGESQLIQSKYEYVFRTKILDFYQGNEIKL